MLPEPEYRHGETVAVELKNVWFRYERDLPDVLRGTSMQVYAGELYAVLGGNGTGKTTMLQVIAGIGKAYRGKVLVDGRLIRRVPRKFPVPRSSGSPASEPADSVYPGYGAGRLS